tara:strand:- start:765 stop:1028 length:264 start_codon:yes stop_codon:yes gene_type:complete
MTKEHVTDKDLQPNTLTKKLTLGAIGAGSLGALLFIIGKVDKNKVRPGSKVVAGVLTIIGKICIAIGIYILAVAVYFSQNNISVSPA